VCISSPPIQYTYIGTQLAAAQGLLKKTKGFDFDSLKKLNYIIIYNILERIVLFHLISANFSCVVPDTNISLILVAYSWAILKDIDR
jgi:hypothetical protein